MTNTDSPSALFLDDPSTPDAPVTPIERPTLHSAVVSRIRDMIVEGQLQTGMRIHEGELGRQLGVSRTPLREALKVLAMEGLVELVPGRGALVRTLGPKEFNDMLVVLQALERLAGKLACDNGSDEGVAEIRRLHDAMRRCHEARNRLEYFKLNQQIHSTIIALGGNDSLVLMQGMLQARMRRIRFLGLRTQESWEAAMADHEEMITALEARDGDRLADALVEHLKRTLERVQSAI